MKKFALFISLLTAACATTPRPAAEPRLPEPSTELTNTGPTDDPTPAQGSIGQSAPPLLYEAVLSEIDNKEILDKARSLLQRLAADTNDIELRIELARLFLRGGYPIPAIAPARDALLLRPGDPTAVAVLAEAQLQANRAEDAVALATQLVADQSGDASRWVLLAEVNRRAGKLRQAERSATRALLLDNAEDEARFIIARVHAEKGNHDLAETLLKKLENSKAVDRAAVVWQLSRLAIAKQDWGAALEYLNRAVGLRQDFAPAWNDRGYLLTILERWDEAEADFRKALEEDGNLGEAHLNLANFLIDRDLAAEALPALKSAASAGVDKPAFALAAGRYYALDATTATGRNQALAYFESTLELLPEESAEQVGRAIAKLRALPDPANTSTKSSDTRPEAIEDMVPPKDFGEVEKPAQASPPKSTQATPEHRKNNAGDRPIRSEEPADLERYLPSVN